MVRFIMLFHLAVLPVLSWAQGCLSDVDCGLPNYCVSSSGFCTPTYENPGFCVEMADYTCAGIWDPVCSCDGITYSNDCEANYQNYMGIQHWGECETDCDDDVCVTPYIGEAITEESIIGLYQSTPWYFERIGDTLLIKATYSWFEGMDSYNLRMITHENALPEFVSFTESSIYVMGGPGPGLNLYDLTAGEIQIQDWGEDGIYSGMIHRYNDSDIAFWTDSILPEITCTDWGDCPEFFICKSDYDDCSTEENSGVCVLYHYDECGFDNDPVCSCNGNTYQNECWADLAIEDIAYSGECSDECSTGDVNDDGQLNVLDIVASVQHILENFETANMDCADMNMDGVINISDIVLMVNAIIGL